MRHVLRSSPVLALLVLAACAGTKAAAPAATEGAAVPATRPAPAPTAPVAPATATVSLPVGGMTCGGCARRVTNALQAVNGVEKAEVILAEKRAIVTYDPARCQPAALVSAVKAEGYDPGQPTPVKN